MQEDGKRYLDLIQYFDGLGRPNQTVRRGVTLDGHDLVSLQTYDGFGRKYESWLPAVVQSNNGKFVAESTVKANAKSSNGDDENPYSKTVYELSPLSKVIEQYAPGKDWHINNKSVKVGYLTNKSKSGTALGITDTLVCPQIIHTAPLTYSYSKVYDAEDLYVTRQINEDGNKSYQFKDKMGQLILTRQINDDLLLCDTYYVYDDFGRLSAVFPPEATHLIYSNTNQLKITSDAIQKYAYLYTYNSQHDCISKKLPGADWIYYINDGRGDVVFSQNGEQRKRNNEWSFTLRDNLHRVVLVGIVQGNDYLKSNTGYTTLGAEASNTPSNEWYTISGVVENPDLGAMFDFTPTEIFQAYYYDNYDFVNLQNMSNTLRYVTEQGYDIQYDNAKGLLTGSMTAIIDDVGVQVKTYNAIYYDYRGRIVQTHSSNHLGGKESEYLSLNFLGSPLKSMRTHTNPKAGETTTEIYSYTYNHTGHLLNTYLQLNNGVSQLISSNTYDQLGRLKINKKGNNANLETTYTYDVQSRTKKIHNDHLNFTLDYTHGGNISKQSWTQSNINRNYTFSYDGLSRLKSANFFSDIIAEKYSTNYTYDRHGNIKNLKREGKKGFAYGLVDNLDYTYNGNQLIKITDAIVETAKTESETDFFSQNRANAHITYNANGAMDSDSHKGIGQMVYNALDLPATTTVDSHQLVRGSIKYLYSGKGVKVQTVHTENANLRNVALMGTTTYADRNIITTVTDYIGNKVYENNKLKRILIPGGYIENNQYYYYLTDHLGNNRAVATASGSIAQRTQYYPFGLAFADADNRSLQPYKYNGKEQDSRLQLNTYDYVARYMDPAIGRFTSIDPHAENYYSHSPYAYVGNNPMRLTDPTGMDWWSTNNKDEIERILAQIKSEGMKSINEDSFGEQWTRYDIQDDAIGMGVFDDQAMSYSIDGVSHQDFKGFGGSAGGDYWAGLLGLGLQNKGGSFTMSIQTSMGKYQFLRQGYHSAEYSSKAMSSMVSLSKLRIGLSGVGSIIGYGALGVGFVSDGIKLRNHIIYGEGSPNSITPLKFGVNTSMSIIGTKLPHIGIGYHTVDQFYPNGWSGFLDDYSKYSKVQHPMGAHPMFGF